MDAWSVDNLENPSISTALSVSCNVSCNDSLDSSGSLVICADGGGLKVSSKSAKLESSSSFPSILFRNSRTLLDFFFIVLFLRFFGIKLSALLSDEKSEYESVDILIKK